ncbi:MAG: 3-deoxy-D-manno-octulosonic acid transferase [Betaproteobacteria bacterium]|nr:3-deoxy-D-manno-octulosonic acid transferase [Betaproteobacteria bacterium]
MMQRALYTLMLRAALPLALARLWWRGRAEPLYRRWIRERFGTYRDTPDKPVIWVHAASVGEARASAPLVRALMQALEGCEILVTCTTAAGRETLKTLLGESVRLAWLPWDLPGAVRRFLEHWRPRLGVLVETEVWPNLVASCRQSGVPLLLANARLSEKSARGYARWDGLSRPAFAALSAVCAQSEADAARLRAAGAHGVAVTGNLKFDAAPDEGRLAAGRALRAALGCRTLLLASTRGGEEAMLLDALGAIPADMRLLVVPRHPRRFDEVAQLLSARGLEVARRSLAAVPGKGVLLGDTLGEMDFYYAAADVAVIGGSFAPLGGQNLIEACAAGAPVVLGPHMYNFAEATRMALDAGAAVQAADPAGAIREALALLEDPARRRAMSGAGLALCQAHRGATARQLAACLRLLK